MPRPALPLFLFALALVGCGSTSAAPEQPDGAPPVDGAVAPPPPVDGGAPDAAPTPEAGAPTPDADVPDAPKTPGTCAALPAANQWQDIRPAGVDWTDAIALDPFDGGTIWLGTNGNGLYKSTDCGASWSKVSVGRNGALMGSGNMPSIAVDPTTPGVIYTTSWMGAEGVWKSTNGGVDWDEIFPTPELANAVSVNSEMSSIAMEAANPKHLIASTHAPCNPPYSPICLAETSDGGQTWHIVDVNPPGVSGPDWTNYMPGAGAFILGAKTWLFGTYSDGLWLTTDDGATWRNVVPAGAWGATGGKTLNQPFVPSPEGTYYLASEQGVLSSKDGQAWSLIPNSGGSSVAFAIGGGHLFASDQWTLSYHMAAASNDTAWSTIPPPPARMYQSYVQGGVDLAYDEPHHVLYSSNWYGGVWRMVIP